MDVTDLPFSQACENNKRPILEVLRRHLQGPRHVLEIGSGTGQHAVFFAESLPQVRWRPSDLPTNLPIVRERQRRAALNNLAEPIELDIDRSQWPRESFQAVFSANTAHIMSWPSVERFIPGAAAVLVPRGLLLLYGPFNYDGHYTSESNARFDQHLRQRDPQSGIRDFESVNALAQGCGLELLEDNAMPANNRLLVWQRRDTKETPSA